MERFYPPKQSEGGTVPPPSRKRLESLVVRGAPADPPCETRSSKTHGAYGLRNYPRILTTSSGTPSKWLAACLPAALVMTLDCSITSRRAQFARPVVPVCRCIGVVGRSLLPSLGVQAHYRWRPVPSLSRRGVPAWLCRPCHTGHGSKACWRPLVDEGGSPRLAILRARASRRCGHLAASALAASAPSQPRYAPSPAPGPRPSPVPSLRQLAPASAQRSVPGRLQPRSCGLSR